MTRGADKRKVALYLPESLYQDFQRIADRTDRSLSWLVTAALRLARERLASMPGVER